jgi:PEP-CTERM motif
MKIKIAATALYFACQISNAMSLDVTATEVTHNYYPGGATVDYMMGSLWGAAASPSFSANFSTEDIFSLTLSAPTGYQFKATPAAGSIGSILSIGSPLSMWIAPQWNGGLRYSLPTTVSLGNFSGPAWYNDTTGVSVDTDGKALMLQGGLWWSGNAEMSFSSITITADLSSLSNKNFSTENFHPDLATVILFQNVLAQGSRVDPGPAINLVASVPEPETYAMLLAGLGLVGLIARRKRGKNVEASLRQI